MSCKLRFVVCPPVPSHVRQCDLNMYHGHRGCSHDWRSIASETYAMDYIGIKSVLSPEADLISRYARQGVRVPECIAVDPQHPDRVISVEVKRICGNQLPLDFCSQTRRKLRRRNRLVWPWETTIYNSVIKAHPAIVADYNVNTHHIVFVIPGSLDARTSARLCKRICDSVRNTYTKLTLPLRHMVVHIIQGRDELFDRF